MSRVLALCLASFAFLAAPAARAREPEVAGDAEVDLGGLEDEALGPRGNMRTRAESVSFDAKERSLELQGNVRIDAPPFHLRSQHLVLARTRYGIEVDGEGRLAFCPCLGTPLTIEFEEAIVAPPAELILKAPKLEIYGVPVMYLPWFWLRGDEKVGLLPPDVAYRGQDGLYLGAGAHLPWKDGGQRRTLDVRGGAYLVGGFVADVRLRSAQSATTLRWDRRPGARAPVLLGSAHRDDLADDGLLLDARGATNDEHVVIAWDADALRGRRGVVATSDLDAAAKPFDRAAASGTLLAGPVSAESGMRAVTRRGGDLGTIEAVGPFVALRSSGAVLGGLVYDATLEGGSVRVSGPAASLAAVQAPALTPDSVSYARADLGLVGTTSLGPLTTSLDLRGAGDVGAEGRRSGSDRAGSARLRFGVPLARAYRDAAAGADPDDAARDPWVHVIEPHAEAAIVHAEGDAILGSLPGRGLAALSGTAPITDLGLATSLGRWAAREAIEAGLAFGAAYGSSVTASGVRPLGRGRLAATFTWLGLRFDTGHVLGADGISGHAAVGRVRLGRTDGARLLGTMSARNGIDPLLARALTQPSVEAPAGLLAREGATLGSTVVVPWAHAVTTSVGADLDANTRDVVAARAGLELHDRCNCLTLRANGSHRIGRQGVDVWLAIDFATDR